MTRKFSRRFFLGLSAGLLAVFATTRHAKGNAATGFRIFPLPGKNYNKGFLKICSERRFHSAEEAIMSVRDEEVEYKIVKD